MISFRDILIFGIGAGVIITSIISAILLIGSIATLGGFAAYQIFLSNPIPILSLAGYLSLWVIYLLNVYEFKSL